MDKPRVVVIGAGGRIGTLLRRHIDSEATCAFAPVYLNRDDWDITSGPPVSDLKAALVIDLSGVVKGEFGQNPVLAQAVASVAKRAKARLIHLSSAAVYPGGLADMDEDTPPAPPTPYGLSKLAAEQAVRQVMPNALILRVANVAGLDALIGGLRPGIEAVIDPITLDAAGPIRSYIGPMTLAAALRQLIELELAGNTHPRTLNLAQPGEIAMAELVAASGHPWRFGPKRDGVLERVVLSTVRVQRVLSLAMATPKTLMSEVNVAGLWP